MTRIPLRTCLAIALATAALAGCGGGDGDNTVAIGGGPATDLPASARQSSAGLVAYLDTLISDMTNATAEPVVVGDAALPTSDSTEPIP